MAFARRFFPWAAVLATALGLRIALLRGLDLSDLPGPAGAAMVAEAITWGKGLYLWGLAQVTAWPGLAPLEWVRLWGLAWSLVGLLGLALAGWALGGRSVALATALVGSLWSQSALGAVLLGWDNPAVALAWLGVGLAWAGARGRIPGLFLAALGGALVVWGAQTRESVLPCLAFLALAPLLTTRRPLRGLAVALLLGASVALTLHFTKRLGQISPGMTQPSWGWDAILLGLQRTWNMGNLAARGGHDGGLRVLLCLAGAGMVLPGRSPGFRWILGAGCAVILGLLGTALGGWLQPRVLVGACLGVLVLVGAGTAHLGRWLGPLGFLAPLLVGTWLLGDTLAFTRAWSLTREREVGTAPTTLPRPPAFFERYGAMRFDTSTSTRDGAALVRWGLEAPQGGVAVIPIQDRREAHVAAGAALAGRGFRVLRTRGCCAGMERDLASCAARAAEAFDARGTTVWLPLLPQGEGRVPREDLLFVRALEQDLGARPGARTWGQWLTWQGTGQDTSHPWPCQEQW